MLGKVATLKLWPSVPASKTFTLDKNEYTKTVYRLTATLNGRKPYLYIAAPVRRMLELFGDETPELMLQWLIDQLENPAAAKLKTKKFSHYFENDLGNRVAVVAPVLTPAQITTLGGLIGLQLEAIASPAPRVPVRGR